MTENDIESRLDERRRLLLDDLLNNPTGLNLEALLDALIVVYDDCSSSTLRQGKAITEFLEYSKIFFFIY